MASYEIEQIFRIACPDCKEQHETTSWLLARDWLIQHRKSCPLFRIRRGEPKPGRMVACPICGESRYLRNQYIKQSERLNADHPELIGIHRSCRMRVIKPALKRR